MEESKNNKMEVCGLVHQLKRVGLPACEISKFLRLNRDAVELISDLMAAERDVLRGEADDQGEMCDDLRRRYLDPIYPCCEVCGGSSKTGLGGVMLIEDHDDDDNSEIFTPLCQSCWDTFTNIKPEYRVVDSWFKKVAIRMKIGTDRRQIYEWLNPKVSFQSNVREFLARQGRFGKPAYQTVSQPILEFCIGCLEKFSSLELIPCRRCKMTPYCSEECRLSDEGRHSEICIEFVGYVGRYTHPDEQYCGYCRKTSEDDKLKACSGCKTEFYCSKTCQKRDWKNHKRECAPS